MNITSNQADALADFLLTLRPDWSKRFVVAALRNAYAISPDVEQLTRVAVRCALTAKIIKPDVIGMRGEHWKAQADERAEPPRPPARCPTCRDWHLPASPCTSPASSDHGSHAAAMRTDLANTRHALCSHGVRPVACGEHRKQRQEAT